MDRKSICILTPCYNDFNSLQKLLSNIDSELHNHKKIEISVIVINDKSSVFTSFMESCKILQHITQITMLNLSRNVGHQRAICIGLAYVASVIDVDGVVVMDSDGEDNYQDVFRMINEISNENIIFAKRRKRSENLLFRVFYYFYKCIFQFLTGYTIQGGNFSLIPTSLLSCVVHLSEIWNHYHAGILKSKMPIRYIECDRAERYEGKSKMNFYSLVIHGLSSLSVFNEIVFVRLTCFSMVAILVDFHAIFVVVLLKLVLHINIPVIPVLGVFLIFFIQSLLIFFGFSLFILNNRNNNVFLLIDDYKDYIDNIEKLY